jgi:hypothetical protein
VEKIVDLLLKAWEQAGSPLWDSLVFWRITALVLASGIALAWFFRKALIDRLSHEKFRLHDRNTFDEADQILPEVFIDDVLSWVQAHHRIAGDDSDRLKQFCAFIGLETNQFLIPQLRSAALEVGRRMASLRDFIAQHFFRERDLEDRQYSLYPDLRNTEDPERLAKYNEFERLLVEQIKSARLAYKSYRRAVKRRLFV